MDKTTIDDSLKWDVHAGDARLVLPDTFVADVMVVDPPYRAHVHENAVSQDQHTDGNVRHNDLGFDPITMELRTWICKLAARTRRWSIIYTDIESVAAWKAELELAGATYIRTLPWVRWSSPQLSGDRPPQGFECLVVAHGSQKGKKHWNGAGNLTHLAHLALRGNGKHKTEKPLDQLLDLVSWFSDPGEMVVDPCAGSGTGGVACKILGRSFMGCELDAEWVTKANDRILKCDPVRLQETLSDRDLERLSRWTQATEEEKVASGPRKENTERVRKRLADKKAALRAGDEVTQREMLEKGVYVVLQTEPLMFDETSQEMVPINRQEEIVVIPQAWTEAYALCIAELALPVPMAHCGSVSCLLRPLQSDQRETGCGCGCSPCTALSAHLRPPTGPKPSAAERTVPLFDPPFEDEWTARKWREAYDRSLIEVCAPLPASPQIDATRMDQGARSVPGAESVSTTEAEMRCPACIDEPVRCEACRGFLGSTPPTYPGSGGERIPGAWEATGVIPAHVLAELGMHPALVDEPVRNRALVRARHERWPDDWLVLQERAPVGFFTRVLKEMQMAPGESLAALVATVQAHGLRVGVFDVAGWSPFQRDMARAWVAQNSERPSFFDQYASDDAGTLGSCTACGRGDNRPFTHSCEKGQGLGESKQPTEVVKPLPQLAPPGEKRRGRPPGVKNKAPKEWKKAYERVMVEMGAS